MTITRGSSAPTVPARTPRRARVGFERLEVRCVPAVISVGPGQKYVRPSQAAAVARDGDVINIAAGTYKGDTAIWRANNLTINGSGGRAVLDATGVAIPNGKAIWVVVGGNTKINNVEFVGAHDASGVSKNHAGIRQEGAGLSVYNCAFRDNDNGILAGANAASDISVSTSEFARNGYGDGYSHNIYIGKVRSFALRYSYSHDAKNGHLVKSRALTNTIAYNKLADGSGGTSSYEIDLPNGGDSTILGNVIVQGPRSPNSNIIQYAAEGATNPVQKLRVVNNTFVNNLGRGVFVSIIGTPTEAKVMNNIFAGAGQAISGKATATTNLSQSISGFVNASAGDYRLAAGSKAIDSGTDPGSALMPLYENSIIGAKVRKKSGKIDLGAYEF